MSSQPDAGRQDAGDTCSISMKTVPVRSAVATTRQQSSIEEHSGTSTMAWQPDSMAAQAMGIWTLTSVVTATASGSTSRSMRS